MSSVYSYLKFGQFIIFEVVHVKWMNIKDFYRIKDI